MLSDKNRMGRDIAGVRNQWAYFIFAPQGRNHAHTLYQSAEMWHQDKSVLIRDQETGIEEPKTRKNWTACMYKASETGYIHPRELEDAYADMGQARYQQEYECSFDAAIQGAIFAPMLE